MQEKCWRFKMLGTFEVSHNQIAVTGMHRNKHCQMLAFLAYTPGKNARERLSARFWPQSDDGDNNLSQALRKLKRILGLTEQTPDSLLQSPGDGTHGLLSELFTRDIDEFNSLLKGADRNADTAAKIGLLTAAVKLYRGEFMLGYDTDAEYGWIEKPRLDYRNKFALALTTLGSLFRERSLTDLAIVCENHAANEAPLTADECALLENWNETLVMESAASASPAVGLPRANAVSLPKAIAAYNEGRRLWKLRAEGALRESLKWFQRAIDADPDYVLAYAGMADAYSLLGYYSYMEPNTAVSQAQSWVREAGRRTQNASDDAKSAVLTSDAWLKMVFAWKWIEAEEAFIEALQLNPRSETASQWYSYLLMLRGDTQQSLQKINTAWDLEPQSGILSKSVGERYHYKGFYQDAIEKYKDALKSAPRYCLTHYCLGKAYEQQAVLRKNAGLTEEAKDKFEMALASFQRAIELSDVSEGPQNPSLSAGIAHAYAKSGEIAKACALLERLKEQRQTDGCYVSPVALATVYLGLDEWDTALDCLETALDEHPGDLVLIHIDPRFLSLRNEARFEKVIRKIGLFY